MKTIASRIDGNRIWARIIRGRANHICQPREYWTWWATSADVHAPIAHATICAGRGWRRLLAPLDVYAMVDWFEVTENARRQRYGFDAVKMIVSRHERITLHVRFTPEAMGFWNYCARKIPGIFIAGVA